MREAVIVDAVRTPVGRRDGALKGWHPVDLLAHTLKAIVQRSKLDPALIEDGLSARATTQIFEGLVAFEANPHHRRAQLVALTKTGREAFKEAMKLQAPWVNALTEGLTVEDVATVRKVAAALRERLEGADQ